MESVIGIVDFLKMEHSGCLQRGELWDTNAIQNTILEFLQDVGEAHGPALTARCVSKVGTLFGELYERATDQNRWQTAGPYQWIVGLYEQYWEFFSLNWRTESQQQWLWVRPKLLQWIRMHVKTRFHLQGGTRRICNSVQQFITSNQMFTQTWMALAQIETRSVTLWTFPHMKNMYVPWGLWLRKSNDACFGNGYFATFTSGDGWTLSIQVFPSTA